MNRPLCATLVALLASCADPVAPTGPDAGTSLDAASVADAASASDAGSAADASLTTSDAGHAQGDTGPQLPILERPAGATACRVSQGLVEHPLRAWDRGQSLATTSGGVAFFARAEGARKDPFDTPELALTVSTLGTDATFGASVLPAAGVKTGPVALAPRGEGLALVFLDAGKLRFAGLDATGKVSLAAGAGLATADAQSRLALAAGANGFGLVFTVASGESQSVRFLGLDADGVPRGAARTLHEEKGWSAPAVSIAPAADGYAVLSTSTGATKGVLFTSVDGTGAERVALRRVSVEAEGCVSGGGVGFAQSATALVAVPGGFVAAWPEAREAMDGSSVIRVARLDEAGAVQSGPVEVRRREKNVDEVEPTLLPFGDSVALLWGKGTHIYICGGCMPDTTVELVLLDPATLDPRSNVATLAPGKTGGFLRREATVVGKTLLTTFEVTFHVSMAPGTAAFSCE